MAVVLVMVSLSVALAVAPGEQQPMPEVRLPVEKPDATLKPSAETVSRGQLLYENHCMICHESVAHIRDDRRAKSFKALEAWVVRWANQQELDWDSPDIVEVVDYLNRRYYKFLPPGNN